MAKPAKSTCVVCKTEKECFHSLSIQKAEGKWKSNPVCPGCRRSLQRDAREAEKAIVFYSLESSIREADRRNSQRALNRPFLEAFGKAYKEKSVTTPKTQSRC